MSKRPVTQPSLPDEQELLRIWEAEKDVVTIRGRKFNLAMLNGHARIRLTKILMSRNGKEEAVTCKCLAAARLNGYFRIKLFYWLVWRWYYYIRQYNEDELEDAIALIKKKVPAQSYFGNIISLTEIRATMMQMNREEVYRTLRERLSDSPGSSAKNSPGSPAPSR